ncbi:MAG: TrbC/VirB2 family type IV secretion system protein [Caulobacteraceae bacterium]
MKALRHRRHSKRVLALAAAAILASGFISAANASTTTGAMPWDSVLTTIETDLTGPVAVAVATIAVVMTGLGIAMGQEGSAMRKGFGICFGLAIALMGTTAILTFFGSSAGAVF